MSAGLTKAAAPHVQRVRCAIYTRKSSEEGLEQGFNSLDAQYEACAAYVLSQAHEGWALLPARYDDGGLSGGTLERPALQRLLANIAAGLIDTVVVYKVDRLSRSLFDFAKLVEAFEANGTSFISITQSFNTTTSMGRLTLNMLLSFAQFEREVTAERIRDKIAASKAKGMWMGGTPPIGYRPDGRTLAIVEADAATVRDIFRRYLALGNVRHVAEQLERDGVRTPPRTTSTGKAYGGVPFSRGQIYKLLSCALYIGEVHHKGQVHPGLHQAIVDRDLYDRTQALLASNRQGNRTRVRAAQPSLLAGKLVDQNGQPLIAVHASKGKVRYLYYVSRDLHHGQTKHGLRLPAREIERAVAERLAHALDDPLGLVATADLQVRPDQLAELDQRCRALGARLRQQPAHARDLLAEVRVGDAAIAIACDGAALAAALQVTRISDAITSISLTVAAELRRAGGMLRLVQGGGALPGTAPDAALVRLLLLSRRWWSELRLGEIDITALAAREGRSPSYVTRIVRLAFLSPAVTSAILAGKQRTGVDVAALTLRATVPSLWSEQAEMLSASAGPGSSLRTEPRFAR